MLKKISIILSLLILASGCGFEPLYSSKRSNTFSIEKIDFIGNKSEKSDRILNNYLRSNLNNYKNKDLSNKIFLDVETVYEKNIISKDATGKIDEYEIVAKVTFIVKPKTKKLTFTQRKIMKNIDNNSDERNSELAVKQTFANIIANNLIQNLIGSY